MIPTLSGLTAIWLMGLPLAAQDKPQLAEEAFKNIQVLRGISVDDFLGTMGIMSAAVGFDCSECHTNAGTDRVDWASDTPKKITSRRMVRMVTAINKDNFGGRQMVTCWSCHRGRDRPAVTPTMDIVYGTPPLEMDDILVQAQGQPPASEVLDKYIQAVGGAQRLAGLTSFIAKAKATGFGGFGGGGQVQVYAKAPDQRSVFIEFPDALERGDSIRSYNGSAGWIKTPLAVLTDYALSGSELDGARLDAQLSFPGQIKQVLTNLKVSLPESINEREAVVVQGTGPRGLLATLYFDKESGLLLRMLRYGRSPIGRIPTQVDYSDYRDVNGIKFPFKWTFTWLDGRDTFELTDVQLNVPIDAAKFGRPVGKK
jgi:photosynthetic reaction center cytochrome c subunit